MSIKTDISDKNEKLTIKIKQHKKETKFAQKEQEMFQNPKIKNDKTNFPSQIFFSKILWNAC